MARLIALCFLILAWFDKIAALEFDGKSIIILSPNEIAGNIEARKAAFEEQYGGVVTVRRVQYSTLAETTQREVNSGSEFYDVYVVQSTQLPEYIPGLEDLTDTVRSDHNLINWEDIFPIVKETMVTFQGRIWAIPIDQDTMYVQYREDVRLSLGLPVPETWEDVIDFASKAHGTDLNGDGTPDFGWCVPTAYRTQAKWNFLTVYASIVQTEGTNQGIYFDKVSMDTYWNTEAGRYAAEVWARLSKYVAAEYTGKYTTEDIFSGCTLTNNATTDCTFWKTVPRTGNQKPFTKLNLWPWFWLSYAAGRCAISVDWAALSSLQFSPPPAVSYAQNKMRSALVGSEWVMNKINLSTLVQCTKAICPHGFKSARTGKWINAAPFLAAGGMALAMNSRTQNKEMAYRFMAFASAQSYHDVPVFSSWIQAFRHSHLNDQALYDSTGLDQETLSSYMQNYISNLLHPNAAMDLRILGGPDLHNSIDDALVTMLGSLSSYTDEEISQVASTFASETESAFSLVLRSKGLDDMRMNYRLSLNDRLVTPEDLAKCSAGTYFSVAVFRCVSCGRGRFSDESGKSRCEICQAGKFQNASGAQICFDCHPGTFQDFQESSSCRDCGVGQATGDWGAKGCSLCATGKFQDEKGQSECKDCSLSYRGTVSQRGATSVGDCECEVGSYFSDSSGFNASGGICESCGSLWTTRDVGALSEDDCIMRTDVQQAIWGAVVSICCVVLASICTYCTCGRTMRRRRRARLAQLEAKQEQAYQDVILKANASMNSVDFPMVLIRADLFFELGRLITHETLRDDGYLTFLDTIEEIAVFKEEHYIVFFSHQWLSCKSPDPARVQYRLMCAAMRNMLGNQELCSISEHSSADRWYIWCDYLSIPQTSLKLQSMAITALPIYACVAHAFVIVAPTCEHADNGTTCNLDTYMLRGWCRAEMFAKICGTGLQKMYIASEDEILRHVPADFTSVLDFRVFQGKFSCCDFNHAKGSKCDKESLVIPILGLYLLLLRQSASYSHILERIETEKHEYFPATFNFITLEKQEQRELFGPVVKMIENYFAKADWNCRDSWSQLLESVNSEPSRKPSSDGLSSVGSCRSGIPRHWTPARLLLAASPSVDAKAPVDPRSLSRTSLVDL